MTWCGYIDVLGTKELADHAIDELKEHLDWFHVALLDNFVDHYNGRCIAASDGAFFENNDKDDFFPYYRRVRNRLFDKGVFFKCSYIPGGIEFIREQVPENVNDGEEPRFVSLNFSDRASQAYRSEARLKGIGCTVEGYKASEAPDNIISNFFVIKEGANYVAKQFSDFRFSEYEIGEGDGVESWKGEQRLLDKIFYHTSLVSMDSEYAASKYVPIIVNAIRSTDFSNLSLSGERWKHAPYVLRRIVSSRSVLKGFSRLPGSRFIVLALFDQYFADNGGEFVEDVERKIVRFIANRRDCQSNLGAVPDFVLRPAAKRKLIKSIAELKGIKKTT